MPSSSRSPSATSSEATRVTAGVNGVEPPCERLLHALPVEVEARHRRAARALPCSAGHRRQGEPRRRHERLLRSRDDDVEAPGIGLEWNGAEAGDRVDHQERTRVLCDTPERLEVGDDAGRRLRVDDDDDLRPGLGESRAQIVGLRRLPPGVPELVHVCAERRRHRAPAVAERSGRDDEDALARRQDVHERGLERTGAGCGEEQDVVLGAADLLQAAERPEHELAKVRPAMMDDRLGAGGQRLGRNGRRPGCHEVALPRHRR